MVLNGFMPACNSKTVVEQQNRHGHWGEEVGNWEKITFYVVAKKQTKKEKWTVA